MKSRIIVLASMTMLLVIGSQGFAQQRVDFPPGVEMAAEPGVGAPKAAVNSREDDRLPIQKQDQWQFFLSPYLWITGINGNISTLKGTMNPAIPWWDVVSVLFSKAMGVMGRAEVWKGRWGVILDGYFTYVGSSGSQVGASREKTFGPVDFTINKQIHLGGLDISVPIPGQIGPGNITLTPSASIKYISRIGNLDLGVRYLVGTWPLRPEKPLPALSVELLGGPRLNSINQYVRINLSAVTIANVPIDIGRFSLVGKHQTVKNGSLVIDYNKQYLEPFLGVRLGMWLTPKFLVNFMGDVGGFGLVGDDHVDCNLEALLGYRVSKHVYAWAGYRAQGSWYDFGKDLVQVNVAMWAHGPVLGMTYTF
jgi:hypothetical protein